MKRTQWNPHNDMPVDLDDLLQRGFRYALALTRSSSQAEDLVQEACMRLLHRGRKIELPLLFKTIRNHFIDLYRHAKRFPKESMGSKSNIITLPQSSAQTQSEDRYAERDLLEKSLEKLSDEEREAMFLWAVEGYTAKEIAGIGSLSRNTVLSRIHRARNKLRNMLHKSNTEVAP